MPFMLARHFVARREYLATENSYRNGERQVGLLVSTSRKTFEMTAALTAAELQTLRELYDATNSGLDPLYFYYGPETSPPYSSNPSGSDGRYTVRWESEWNQRVGIARSEVSMLLVEVN